MRRGSCRSKLPVGDSMKNQNDTGATDRKSDDPDRVAPAAPADPTSATGMFQQLSASPGRPEVDDPNFEDPNPVFRAVASGEGRGRGDNAVHPPTKPAHPAADAGSSLDEKASPGEFTRLFQAITPNAQTITPGAAIIPNASGAAPASSPTPSPASTSADAKPGEFTRIFMRLPKAPDAEPLSAVPATPVSPPETGSSQRSETGEFTRLMRAAELGAKAPAAGGAAAVVTSAPSSTPVRGVSATGANDAVSGTAGVTELFAAATHRPAAAPAAPAFSSKQPGWPSDQASNAFREDSLPRREQSSAKEESGKEQSRQEQSAGEFTQLFRALDHDRESYSSTLPMERPSSPVAQHTPQAEKLADAGAGEFTQLMQSLSHERPGGSPAGTSAPPRADMAASGLLSARRPGPMPTPSAVQAEDSGSFTRIISSSLAREEAAQGAKLAAEAQAPGAYPAKDRVSVSPPAAIPGMPGPPQGVPIPRAASFGQPSAAAAPTPPSPAPTSVPQSKLQAYLPLLLIVNAFALAVLIVLVIFALRRH
jgi:hypothetical protein